MTEKVLIEDILEPATVDYLNKLMKIRKERQKDDLSMNIILRFIIEREIQIIKDDYPTKKDLKERNLKRIRKFQKQKENPEVYCPQFHIEIQNLMMCHVSCPFGHMLECHYPYDCNSDYCQHYKTQRELESQFDFNNLNPGEGPVI